MWSLKCRHTSFRRVFFVLPVSYINPSLFFRLYSINSISISMCRSFLSEKFEAVCFLTQKNVITPTRVLYIIISSILCTQPTILGTYYWLVAIRNQKSRDEKSPLNPSKHIGCDQMEAQAIYLRIFLSFFIFPRIPLFLLLLYFFWGTHKGCDTS